MRIQKKVFFSHSLLGYTCVGEVQSQVCGGIQLLSQLRFHGWLIAPLTQLLKVNQPIKL